MRTARATLVLGALLALALLPAAPAQAAAPSNDLAAFPTPISVGFSETLDTTEATTDADDAQANSVCGAPATDASVWYSLAPAADAGVVVDVGSSSYTAGVIVATGSPGSLDVLTCAPGAASFSATAGQTYLIMAFDDQLDGGGNGGTLTISVTEAAVPSLAVTVEPVGRVDARTGIATLRGTLTCTGSVLSLAGLELHQAVGRFTISGFTTLDTSAPCDGTTRPWTVQVSGTNGKFAGGRSAAVSFTFACGVTSCAEGYETHRVMLKGGKK